MGLAKDKSLNRFKFPMFAIAAVLSLVVLLAVFTNTFETSKFTTILQLMLLIILLLLVSTIVFIVKLCKISANLNDNSAKFEKITDIMEKNRSILTQINQHTRLTEIAKSIAFRDADRQSLRGHVP